ncbi:hypothetical protein M378DRAFT_584831 [Amanita muscaria Koide BX008]|nr:hypothetical protein M378DRAFT_584831 [Amanita muscaria Koide BX008]
MSSEDFLFILYTSALITLVTHATHSRHLLVMKSLALAVRTPALATSVEGEEVEDQTAQSNQLVVELAGSAEVNDENQELLDHCFEHCNETELGVGELEHLRFVYTFPY